jgi:hypothetical protein
MLRIQTAEVNGLTSANARPVLAASNVTLLNAEHPATRVQREKKPGFLKKPGFSLDAWNHSGAGY